MTSSQYAPDYIEDIVDGAKQAQEFMDGMDYSDFTGEAKTVFATIRALEVIGEAANRIPADVQRLYQEIPWRDMNNMRNRLIHNYDEVNFYNVWSTIVDDVPQLIANLEKDRSYGSEVLRPRLTYLPQPHNSPSNAYQRPWRAWPC